MVIFKSKNKMNLKMNRTNLKKVLLLTTLGIAVLSLIPAVQATQPSISIRPIEDWLKGNPFGGGPGYYDPARDLSQRCFMKLTNPEFEGSYTGEIVEVLRNDKSLYITVFLSVEGMPMGIFDWSEDTWIFFGEMNFTYTAAIILEKKVPGGYFVDNVWDDENNLVFVPDNKGELQPLVAPWLYIEKEMRKPGAPIPSWWILYWYQRVVGAYFVMSDFQSSASGNYVNNGEPGNVECHQMALYSDKFDVDDPDVYQWTEWTTRYGVFYEGGPLKKSPLLMPEMWPYEDIILS
jgi:hypothetical protein